MYGQEQSSFSVSDKRHSRLRTFSHPFCNGTCSKFLFHNKPANGWPLGLCSTRTTRSSILSKIFRMKISRWSDPNCRALLLRKLQQSGRTTHVRPEYKRRLHQSPSLTIPGQRDIVSRTFAAVMREADAPCSVNTAYPPVSSFTLSPLRTTLPLYVCTCSASPECFK